MSYVLSLWKGKIPVLRIVIERVAAEEARKVRATLGEVLGESNQRHVTRARRKAFYRVIAETGCSVSGLARTWGCDRRTVQRALRGRRAA